MKPCRLQQDGLRQLLPGLALEAIPGFGVLPFWLLVVGAIAVLGTPRPTFERH